MNIFEKQYICFAEIIFPGELLSVYFAAPPILGEVSPSFLVKKVGESVELHCEAMATPSPNIIWLKNGSVLSPSENVLFSGNRILLRRLDRHSGGVYTCTFKNVVGQVSHNMRLVIEGE